MKYIDRPKKIHYIWDMLISLSKYSHWMQLGVESVPPKELSHEFRVKLVREKRGLGSRDSCKKKKKKVSTMKDKDKESFEFWMVYIGQIKVYRIH